MTFCLYIVCQIDFDTINLLEAIGEGKEFSPNYYKMRRETLHAKKEEEEE